MADGAFLHNTPTDRRKHLQMRYKVLEDDRSSWRSHWQELSDYLLPRRGRYLNENSSSRGRKRNTKIIDNTGGQALRTLASGMMSGMTSPARPWFRFQTPDRDMMKYDGVTKWLGIVEVKARQVLNSTNFYNSAHTLYHELGGFGTAPMFRRAHPSRLMQFRNLTAGEYVIACDQFDDVTTLGRRFTMTVQQVVEQFVYSRDTKQMDWDGVSKATKNCWDRGQYDTLVDVIHMVAPRPEHMRDPRKLDGKNRPFSDCYIEVGADSDKFLYEGGHNKFPAYVPRWDVLSGDVYGRCPGMDHLGDIKQLQHEQRRKAQGIDKMVNPPMVASVGLKGKPTTTLPGGNTYVDPMAGAAGFQPAYVVKPDLQYMLMDIQEVQSRINRGFYADLFAMMISSDRRNMTATEVIERHEEKLILLGPVLQRLNVEFLDPLLEDVFDMLIATQQVPEPPQELHGVDLEIEYISILAQAQQAVGATSIERTMGFAGNLAGVMPQILDNIDGDLALREYGNILGAPPGVMRDQTAVETIRAEREQQMAQQQQIADTQANAQSAKLLSEADTTSPNALTRLLGGGGRV